MDFIKTNTAIITAAGSGLRMANKTKKQFMLLDGIPILVRSLEPFFASPLISGIIITAPEEEIDYTQELIYEYCGDYDKTFLVMAGGVERQDSVFGALQNCPADTNLVYIHDGVRPFITVELIEALHELATRQKAVIPAAFLKNTIKMVEADFVKNTLQRDRLIQVFTPQVFDYKLLLKSYEKAYQDGYISTDDSALVEHFGHKVYYHIASDLNIKITDTWDYTLAHLILENNIII